MSKKVLFVDDDPNLLAAFQRSLRKTFEFDTALGGLEALHMLKTHGPYAVVVADMRMPGMDGIELLERAREIAPDTVRMMLTGNADQQTAVEAVNRGEVFRFLNKPCPPEVLGPALDIGLKQYELLHMERELLEGTLTGSVKVLAEVLGMVAPEALGRGQRLRESMGHFARFVGATPVWELEIGALLSPIGYASLPQPILQKLATATDLDQLEGAIVHRVPQIGHDLLTGIPRLNGVAQIVLHQHRHFGGRSHADGGPEGESIPIGARLLKILLDRLALENDGVVKQRAYEVMKARVAHYDPRLLDLCFACFQSFLANAISSSRTVLSLPVDRLVPGLVVVSDIYTHEDLLLVGAGNRLTAMILQRLRNYAELGEVKEPIFVQEPGAETVAASAA